MLSALVCIACLALFFLGVLAVYAANLPKLKRYRQTPLPLVAFVYGVLCLLALDLVSQCAYDVLGWGSERISFLGAANPEFAVPGIANFMILVGFAAVKVIYHAVMVCIERSFPQAAKSYAEPFYLYDDKLQCWFLRREFRGARTLSRNLYLVAVVFSAALFVIAHTLLPGLLVNGSFYPAFAILVLGEVCFCLRSITREEYEDDIEFEDEGSRCVAQYAKLKKVLSHYFGDRELLTTSRAPRKCSLKTHEEFCRKLIDSDNYSERLAGNYYRSLLEKGLIGKAARCDGYGELNHDLVLSSIGLLEGKSVMFASPFYRDFSPYLFFVVNYNLMRNRKVLVVYGSEVEEDCLREYVREGLEFVTGIADMWSMGTLSALDLEKPSIAFLPFSSLGDTSQVIANSEYLKDVGFAIVIDPSSLLATYQIGLSILAEYLSKGDAAHYCIFDRNSDGLVDSLSHALRTNLTEVVATEYAEAASVSMFWEADGEHLQHRLLPGIAQYLGVGTEIGFVALKNQISEVSWASNKAVPLADQRWIVGQYYGELLGYAELPQEQHQIDESFKFYSDMWSMRKRSNCLVVAEDEYRNMFEMARQFTTRGSNQAFVNVLSPNYALRSYMVDNFAVFRSDAKAVPSFAPDFSQSQRNIVLSLVMVMVQSGGEISEDEVRSRLAHAGVSVKNVKEAFEGMLIDHVSIPDDSNGGIGGLGVDKPEDHVVVREREEYDPLSREMVTKRYFSLSGKSRYSDCFSGLRNVPLVTESNGGDGVVLGERLYGHVYQTLLPGQFTVFRGKYYEVMSVSEEAGVILRRAADHFNERRYYRQLRDFVITDWSAGEGIGDFRTVSGVRVVRAVGDISVRTEGYLELTDYGDLERAKRIYLSGVPARRYYRKSLLRLEFPEAPAEVVATVAALMSEFMVSLFPRDHAYILVATPCASRFPEGIIPGFVGDDPSSEEKVIYIAEDSLIDIGLVSCIDRNIERILELCWDYLDWHVSKLAGERPSSSLWELGPVPKISIPDRKKNAFERLLDKVKALFANKKKSSEGEVDEPSGKQANGECSGRAVDGRVERVVDEPVEQAVGKRAEQAADEPGQKSDDKSDGGNPSSEDSKEASFNV